MSISLTGTGGLFTRLGRAGGALNSLHTFLGTGDISAGGLKSVKVTTDNIDAEFASSRQDIASGLYTVRDNFRASHGTYLSALQSLAQSILIEMANDDAPLPSKTVEEAVRELRKQMVSGSASVTRPTVSATVTDGTNTGTGKLVASVTRKDGTQEDYVLAETVRVRCTSDAETGSTAGQETFSVQGAVAVTDPLAWNWPGGSGASASTTAVDAASNNDGTNLLQNGGMLAFANSNVPDNWVIATGTAGSTILQSTGSNAHKGSYGLAFVGNGSELTSVTQLFNTTPSTTLGSGGTSADLDTSTVYAVSAFVKMDSTPAAGVLEIALINGATGAILTDAAGNDIKVTQALTSVSTSWVHVAGFFRTPAVLPSTYKLRIRLSTALTSGRTAYIDHVALAEAEQLYAGGPYYKVFSGSTDFAVDDSFSLAVANNYSAKWPILLDRLFNLRSLGIAIPSSGSPTISDSLVA